MPASCGRRGPLALSRALLPQELSASRIAPCGSCLLSDYPADPCAIRQSRVPRCRTKQTCHAHRLYCRQKSGTTERTDWTQIDYIRLCRCLLSFHQTRPAPYTLRRSWRKFLAVPHSCVVHEESKDTWRGCQCTRGSGY